MSALLAQAARGYSSTLQMSRMPSLIAGWFHDLSSMAGKRATPDTQGFGPARDAPAHRSVTHVPCGAATNERSELKWLGIWDELRNYLVTAACSAPRLSHRLQLLAHPQERSQTRRYYDGGRWTSPFATTRGSCSRRRRERAAFRCQAGRLVLEDTGLTGRVVDLPVREEERLTYGDPGPDARELRVASPDGCRRRCRDQQGDNGDGPTAGGGHGMRPPCARTP